MQPLVLFSKVRTPDGVGILIGVNTTANGLYYNEENAVAHVWYGMDNVQNGKVQWTYSLSAITPAEITVVPTDQLRNTVSESIWKLIVQDMHCPTCRMSGGWWAKIDPQYDKPGEEQYRCPECKTVHVIRVPRKGPAT